MGVRFRRRLTLFPGVTLNFSKSGISTTFGVPGASVNVGKDGVFFNAGIPGTGIYTRTKVGDPFSKNDQSQDDNSKSKNEYFQPLSEGEIKSASNDSITSEGLKGLKETFFAALQEENTLKAELKSANEYAFKAQKRFNRFKLIPFAKHIFKNGFNSRKNDLTEKNDIVAELKEQLALCKVELNLELNDDYKSIYSDFKSAFENLLKCEFIWDLVTQLNVDRYSTRSAAYQSVERKKVKFGYKNISFINAKYDAFFLQNANGADLFIYPGFVVLYTNKEDFGLIDFKELNIDYLYQRFIEEEKIPSDSQIIDRTWAKVNKDGSRDLRFKNNYQIPVLAYAKLHLNSVRGLNELYMFSNSESPRSFSDIYSRYKSTLLGHSKTNQKQVTKSSSDKINWALKILGLTTNATPEQIKSSYYDLIKKYHPDKVDGLAEDFRNLAETKSKELNEAYKILLST